MSRCKLFHIDWRNNKDLLYSTSNCIQYPRISHNEKEYEKEHTYRKNVYKGYIWKKKCIMESLCSTAEINTTFYFIFFIYFY